MQIYAVITSTGNDRTEVLGMFGPDQLPEAEALASAECQSRGTTVKVLRFPIYEGKEILSCRPT